MPLYALLLALSVGADLRAAPKEARVKLFDLVGVSAEQIENATAKAKQAFSGEIESIYVGQLRPPLTDIGFRVHFKDEIVDRTYIIQRQFVLKITPGSSIPHGLITSVLRLFQLKTAGLRLYLPDDISYRHAKALLEAIESRTYRVRAGGPKRYVGPDRLNQPINVSAIVRLRRSEDGKTIELWTNGGGIYGFAVSSDEFELVLVSEWMS
jgi:hypothetical protein